MRGIVVGLAGQIGSGKSTVAQGVSDTFQWPLASFGKYVRRFARQLGCDQDRQTLQDLGQDLHDSDPEEFCVRVLRDEAPSFVPGGSLVIDGVRHVRVYDALNSLVYPSIFALVFLRIDERTRQRRFEVRAGEDSAMMRQADEHPTELEVGELQRRAALNLLSTRPSGELVRAIRAWVNRERNVPARGARS